MQWAKIRLGSECSTYVLMLIGAIWRGQRHSLSLPKVSWVTWTRKRTWKEKVPSYQSPHCLLFWWVANRKSSWIICLLTRVLLKALMIYGVAFQGGIIWKDVERGNDFKLCQRMVSPLGCYDENCCQGSDLSLLLISTSAEVVLLGGRWWVQTNSLQRAPGVGGIWVTSPATWRLLLSFRCSLCFKCRSWFQVPTVQLQQQRYWRSWPASCLSWHVTFFSFIQLGDFHFHICKLN